jgi:hypothetical protein
MTSQYHLAGTDIRSFSQHIPPTKHALNIIKLTNPPGQQSNHTVSIQARGISINSTVNPISSHQMNPAQLWPKSFP